MFCNTGNNRLSIDFATLWLLLGRQTMKNEHLCNTASRQMAPHSGPGREVLHHISYTCSICLLNSRIRVWAKIEGQVQDIVQSEVQETAWRRDRSATSNDYFSGQDYTTTVIVQELWVRSVGRMRLARETEVRRGKPVLTPLCLPQIPQRLGWDRKPTPRWEENNFLRYGRSMNYTTLTFRRLTSTIVDVPHR